MKRFPSLALALSPFLLPGTASAASLQLPDLVEALAIEGEVSPYTDALGDSWTYLGFTQPVAGTDGGWVATAFLERDAPSGGYTTAIIGQLPGQLDGRVDVYVAADPSTDDEIFSPSLVGQELTYVLREEDAATSAVTDTILRGGTQLLTTGDPVDGSVGWTWISFLEVTATRSGRVFVVGQAHEPVTDQGYYMMAEVTTGEVLLNGYDFFPGVQRRLGSARLSVSPDGLHWVARAITRLTSEYMLIQDGALVEFAPGFIAYEFEPVPSEISGDTQSTWYQFTAPRINDRGDLAFYGAWRIGAASPDYSWVRNGRSKSGIFNVAALDDRGALIHLDGLPGGGRVKLDGKFILPGQILRVDTDRDGVANAGVGVQYFRSDPVATADPGLIAEARLSSQSPPAAFNALIRLRDYRIDSAICEGSPNSAGSGARISTSGNRIPSFNEARVDVLELPAQASGYLLMSLDSGPGVIPPGAQGELCLAGSIGRLRSQLFTATPAGTARVTPDLRAIPQPTGDIRVRSGETWYAQAWYRDSVGGMPTSNFTTAVAISFD